MATDAGAVRIFNSIKETLPAPSQDPVTRPHRLKADDPKYRENSGKLAAPEADVFIVYGPIGKPAPLGARLFRTK